MILDNADDVNIFRCRPRETSQMTDSSQRAAPLSNYISNIYLLISLSLLIGSSSSPAGLTTMAMIEIYSEENSCCAECELL